MSTLARYLCIAMLMCFTSSLVRGQSESTFRADTAAIGKQLEKGWKYLRSDSMRAAELVYQQAYQRARVLNDGEKISDSKFLYSKILEKKGEYRRALKEAEICVAFARKTKDASLIAPACNLTGHLHTYLGNFKEAAAFTLEALKLAEGQNDLKGRQVYSNNLAGIFTELREQKKSLYYAQQSYKLARQRNDTLGLASTLVNLANSETLNKRFDRATSYFKELIKIGYSIDDLSYVLDAYINLGHVSSEQRDHLAAFNYYLSAVNILKDYPSPEYEFYVYWGLAESTHLLGKHASAARYLERSLKIAEQLNASNQLRFMYLLASEIQEARKAPQQALSYRKKYDALKDSLMNAETQSSIHQLEIEYQTSQKEKSLAQQKFTIARNELEIQRKNRYLFISLFVSVLTLLGGSILYLIFSNRHKRHKEKLKLLQKEKEVTTLEALIAGEEKERSRLAKDLHDGVGGILSATKMHLSALANDNFSLSVSDKFEKTVSMLDTAAGEIRSIAHNLAPELLLHQGLSGAIEQFCRKVQHDNFTVTFYSLGNIERYTANFELFIYRIAQECMNNIIKHAYAQNVFVQLSVNDSVLSLSIEDDGIGFDLSCLNGSNGIGLTNLQSRVATMGGTLDISSSPACGTTIYLEFDIRAFKTREAGATSARFSLN